MQINELINQTKKELKATSVLFTHDIRSALEVGDRLAFHSDGKIAIVAPKFEFLSNDDPLLRDFFANAMIDKSELEKYKKIPEALKYHGCISEEHPHWHFYHCGYRDYCFHASFFTSQCWR